MDCQKTREHLYPYLDRELDQKLRVEIESHLLQCPLCKMEVDREQKFNTMIKNHLVREEAPYDLRERVIAELERPRSLAERLGSLFPARLALNPALAVVIGLIAFALIVNSNKPFPIYAAAVENHIDYLRGGYPPEIRTSNVDEATAWFQGKMDYAIGQPHVDGGKVDLIGARLANIQDKKSAYFIYEKDGHNISAFYVDLNGVRLPRVASSDVKDTPQTRVYYKAYKGYQNFLCIDKASNTGCVIVSDMPKEKLEHILHHHVH